MISTYTAENLLFLLWLEKDLKREDWLIHLAGWAGCSPERAEEVLQTGILQSEERDRIVALTGTISAEELQFERLLEKREINVLKENVHFLISGLQRGKKMDLADQVGVTQTTVARWNSGEQLVTLTHQQRIIKYFLLPSGTDLEVQPLFLSRLPVGAKQMKNWLHQRIDELKPETLLKMYPALERLLRNP